MGEGGIGIVRLSGPDAESLLKKFFRPSHPVELFLSHRLYHGMILSADAQPIDEVLAVLMRRPRSYTCEDVAEVHCHGGPFIVRRILENFILGGARMAEPGEFTLRAFLNGRIDLSRAEAVVDLIRSRSQKAADVALGQMVGKLAQRVAEIRRRILELLIIIEAYIDFPEEEITLPHRHLLEDQSGNGLRELDKLLETFNFGRVAREGLGILLVGRPNVGKSSLLNTLLGEDRAIVTSVPGTTRDIIEESWTLEGFPLRLIDTAGIHDSTDPVEREGMRRTLAKVQGADLILLVIDGSRETTTFDQKALDLCDISKTILVINKCDLGSRKIGGSFSTLPGIPVSARSGQGIDDLKKAIVQQVTRNCTGGDQEETAILSSRRHWESLLRCRSSLKRFHDSLREEAAFECLAVELRDAVQSLGEVTGETLSEEVLSGIFSRFCIGK